MARSNDSRVLIAGAGLAGLTAGYRLQQQGYAVEIFEKRPHAGGRVYSFTEKQTGDPVDNGQHVYLGCCRALRSLLRDVGCPVDEQLQDHLRLVFQFPGDEQQVLSEWTWLPAPAHLLPLLSNASFLTWIERYYVARCFSTIYWMDAEQMESLTDRTMADWLREHHQSDNAIESFWNVFIVSTLNAGAGRVSAASALFVFQEGLLSSRDAGRIGVANRGQSPFYIEPLVQAFREEGGVISRRETVDGLRFEGNRCTGVTLDDQSRREATGVILAVPPWSVSELDGFSHLEPRVRKQIRRFDPSPILCVNLWLEQPIMEEPFLTLHGGVYDWMFHRNRIEGRDRNRPQHLSLVKSAAFDRLTDTPEELRRTAVKELNRFFHGFEENFITHVRVTKEPRATFIPEPGMRFNRPTAETSVDGLYFAGAWTDTGWPSTMESAVRSGEQAADAVSSS